MAKKTYQVTGWQYDGGMVALGHIDLCDCEHAEWMKAMADAMQSSKVATTNEAAFKTASFKIIKLIPEE